MNLAFLGWLKSELTASFFRPAYQGSLKAAFPEPQAEEDILFILASGASVDELLPEQWDVIASQTSIGVNFWTTHSFAPDYYALENARGDVIQALEPLIDNHTKTKEARVLWFGIPNRINRKLLWVFKRLGGDVWFYTAWPLYHDADRDLRGKFLSLFRHFLRVPRRFRPAIDASHTVSRLVTLAALNGWKTTVLLGVDLGGPYFKEYEMFRQELVNSGDLDTARRAEPDNRHSVDAIQKGEFRQSAILPSLDSWIREIGEGQILVGSSQMDKCLRLETYEW